MGSYGIGVSRAVGTIAELNHDEYGLCWPREISPADVHIVATGKESAIFEFAEALSLELEAMGVRVLYDDRPKVSPGVKFKDAELLRVPTIVVVGKNLADGAVEVRDRRTGAKARRPGSCGAAADIHAEVTRVARSRARRNLAVPLPLTPRASCSHSLGRTCQLNGCPSREHRRYR